MKRRVLFGGLVAGSGLAGTIISYVRADSTQRRRARVGAEGIIRFLRSVSVGLAISLDYWWAGRGLDQDSVEYEQAVLPCHQRSANRIVAGALSNGGLYIKLGQGLSTFNQVLPHQYIDTLKSLQDQALARRFRELDTLFLEDFGKSPADLFKSFNPQPLAAASLAQVFKAVTHGNETVAVKAQYIDLRDRYDGDIWTIQFLLKLVGWIHPKFKLSWIFHDLHSTLAEELDFEHEGRNLERCRDDLAGLPYVYLPRVQWQLTSKRVLTAEWIDGCRVTDKKAIATMGLEVADVAHKVITAFAHQLFHSGFVHADPHPGNIFIRPLPGGGHGAQVVLLDHGLYMPLDPSTRRSLSVLWKSIILHDLATLKEESRKLGVSNYEILAVILTGRSVRSHQQRFGTGTSAMTKEDWLAVRNTFVNFDEVIEVLRALPTSLILVVRNLNIVRSLNRELGCPVNRFNIMARSAISSGRTNTHVGLSSLGHHLAVCREQAWFEVRLLWMSVHLWWSMKVLQLMRWAGRIPQEMQMLEQAMLA